MSLVETLHPRSWWCHAYSKVAAKRVARAVTVEEESDYYPFGTEVIVAGPGVNELNSPASGGIPNRNWIILVARYYSNAYGRFLTPDWAAKAPQCPTRSSAIRKA